MAHFAWLDDNNIVYQVSVVDNHNLLDENGNESEAVGITYLTSVHGSGKTWKQTSYNSTFRKNYAGIGFTFDAARDAFIAPQPYPSWVLNETSCQWEAPVAYPTDGKMYKWDEDTTSWVEVAA